MMDPVDLSRIVENLLQDCEVGFPDRQAKRLRALDFFRGKMDAYVPADEGRSSMTSRDVRAVIKKVMPSLKRTILGSDEIVEYKPTGPGDEQKAKDATAYVNKAVVPAARIEDAVSDAMLSAVLLDEGVLTWWHEDKKRVAVTFHSGLSEAEMAAIQSDASATILDAETYEAEIAGVMETLYRARVRRTVTESRICASAVPMEDFIIHPQATSEDDAPVIGHRMRLRRSDLVAMGYDRDRIDNLPAFERLGDDGEDDREARNADDFDTDLGSNGIEPEMQEIEVKRLFVRVDADDDGIAELREIHFVEGTMDGEGVLFDDYADEANYAIVVAERVMHSWQGVSIFDDVEEFQKLKTVLVRQTLDNLYASNNPQPTMQMGAVLNPEAVTSPEFGNPIQVRQGVSVADAVQWRAVPFFAEKTLPMLAKIDQDIIDRTGITSAAGGLDPNAMQNVRERGIDMISDAAAAQAWCMVREMAKGGLKRFFRGILRLVVQHQDKPRQIEINGKWAPFDPRVWNADMDCVVNVGLGTGTRERDLAALNVIANWQMKILEGFGPANPIVGIKEVHNTLSQITKAAGLPEPAMFFREPQEGESLAPPNPGPSPDEMKAQAQIQLEQIKAQAAQEKEMAQANADVAVKRLEAELNAVEAQSKADMEAAKQSMKLEFEARAHADRMQLEWAKFNAQFAGEQGSVDPETGARGPSQVEVLAQSMAGMMESLAQTQALLSAPRRKTAIGPNGKTYEIRESLDLGEVA